MLEIIWLPSVSETASRRTFLPFWLSMLIWRRVLDRLRLSWIFTDPCVLTIYIRVKDKLYRLVSISVEYEYKMSHL